MTTPIRLYSKSSVGVDNKCKRKFYWAYEFEGGISPKGQALELFMGTALHDGLAAIAAGIDIDDIAREAFRQVSGPMVEASTNPQTGVIEQEDIDYASEQATLVEGLLRGFYRHVWPKLMAEYDIFLVEKPMVYRHSDLGFVVKSDLILRSKITQGLVYLEYKSTSSKDDRWVRSWETNVQLHSSVRAIEQAVGEEVEAVIVQGLYKGYQSYGKQSSPFCYAYRKFGQPPFTQDQIAYKYVSGWKRSPTWELPGGVKAWVAGMPDEVLADQFPQTPPIFINNDLIGAFFRQQEVRQHQIVEVSGIFDRDDVGPNMKQSAMDEVFPQNFEECTPAWGSECPYRILCHGPGNQDPFTLGFTKRDHTHMEPFHQVLREQEGKSE
jgi:hypothetical protein